MRPIGRALGALLPLLPLLPIIALGLAPAAAAQSPAHLRLIDRLDRPADGYCVDILGVGRTLRLELPLFAHNCKPRLTPDSAIEMTPRGEIRFVALDLCVTAAGVNATILAGAALILRPCGDRAPFFEAERLQKFDLRADGALVLVGSELCVTVGDEASPTYSPADRWRTLFLARCASAPASRARWELASPPR